MARGTPEDFMLRTFGKFHRSFFSLSAIKARDLAQSQVPKVKDEKGTDCSKTCLVSTVSSILYVSAALSRGPWRTLKRLDLSVNYLTIRSSSVPSRGVSRKVGKVTYLSETLEPLLSLTCWLVSGRPRTTFTNAYF